MSPIVNIDGILTIEDIWEQLIGEDIDDETDALTSSRTYSRSNEVLPQGSPWTLRLLIELLRFADFRQVHGSSSTVRPGTRLRELVRQTMKMNKMISGMRPRAVREPKLRIFDFCSFPSVTVDQQVGCCIASIKLICGGWSGQAGLGRRRMSSASSQRALQQITQEQFDAATQDLEHGVAEVRQPDVSCSPELLDCCCASPCLVWSGP